MSSWAAAVEKYKNEVPFLDKSGVDPEPKETKEDWRKLLQTSSKGRILSNAFNTLLILENDEYLKGTFAYNLLTKNAEIIGKVPWKRADDTKEITPQDDSCLRNYLSVNYGINSKNIIEDGINEIIMNNQFHPIQDYLNSLRGKWDGKNRLDSLLIDFFDAEDTELVRIQTRLALVGAVKRVFQPGCKMDYILTLKGKQGAGKSSFFQRLAANNDWFSDSLDDMRGKDAKDQLKGNWIIELGEMAAVSKGDQKRIKQFITSSEDEYRPAYGKRSIRFKRQNIFVATTNDDLPLKDDTGGRRWWIVEVRSRWFEKDIPFEVDQIWAEALSVYEFMETENIPLKLPNHLEDEAKNVQLENTDRGLYAAEIEQALERGYVEKPDFEGTKTIEFNETCAFHVWEVILGRYKSELTPVIAREINATLKNIQGWECIGRKQFGSYGKQTTYRRKYR